MSIFDPEKKVKLNGCCADNCNAETMAQAETAITKGARVKVLGAGCTRCEKLKVTTIEALSELGLNETVDHVTDFIQIAAYGVMTTPALVVDGKVVSYGKVLKKDEVIKILQQSKE